VDYGFFRHITSHCSGIWFRDWDWELCDSEPRIPLPLHTGTAVKYADGELGVTLHISEKIKDGFAVLSKRWVVERTFAWLGGFRHLAKDFEILAAYAENVVHIAMVKITLAKCV